MTIEHQQSFTGLYQEHPIGYGNNYRRTPDPQKITGSQLPFTLKLAFDFDSKRFIISWADVDVEQSLERRDDGQLHGGVTANGRLQDVEPKKSLSDLAARAATSISSRQPNDVCFDFPRTSRRLWAYEADLVQAFPSCLPPILPASPEIKSQVSSQNPHLPPTVPPKSVYRLAHLLELDDRSSLALCNPSSQLSAANAACELYGDVSCAYDHIRELTLKYVVEKWKEVKESKGLKEVEERARAGEATSQQASSAMELARRFM
ncbi:hypothetical protein JCM11641_003471 [Rhodosporidiobolus odoratus]